MKAEHRLDAGVREGEDIVRARRTADLTVAPKAAYAGPLVGEAVEDLAGTGGAAGTAAAPYEQGELTHQ